MNWRKRFLLPIAAAASIGACQVEQSLDVAESEISTFHRAFDAGQFDAIWTNAGAEFRDGAPKNQFVAQLTDAHAHLGAVKESKRIGWKSNVNENGSFFIVTMQTAFTHGKAVETFVFRKGESLKLIHFAME